MIWTRSLIWSFARHRFFSSEFLFCSTTSNSSWPSNGNVSLFDYVSKVIGPFSAPDSSFHIINKMRCEEHPCSNLCMLEDLTMHLPSKRATSAVEKETILSPGLLGRACVLCCWRKACYRWGKKDAGSCIPRIDVVLQLPPYHQWQVITSRYPFR